jgi:hypothetical protein
MVSQNASAQIGAEIKKRIPAPPSLRRVIGMILLFAVIGLSSCQAFVVSFIPAHSTSSISTHGDR